MVIWWDERQVTASRRDHPPSCAAFSRRAADLSRSSQDRIADTLAYAAETLNAVQTVQAFTHETWDRARFGTAIAASFATACGREGAAV